MTKQKLIKLLEEFRDLKITKKDLMSEYDSIPFGNKEIILERSNIINVLEAFINNKISEDELIDWVNIIWFLDWFYSGEKEKDSISSVMSELEMLEDVPYLRTNNLSVDEARYYINALMKNEDISLKPFNKHL